MATVYGERIARLEEQVSQLDKRMEKLDERMEKIDEKLTELLQLKHKGAGALWLISAIAAIAFTEALRLGVNYFMGK